MAIFSKLHAYQSTEQRSPTEDFLTEVFCEWLRLAGQAGTLNFVLMDLFKINFDKNLSIDKHERNIRWSTQYVIGPGYRGTGKRPDIVGQSDDFFLIIENKITAAFTNHEDDNGSISQLDLYSDFQHRQNKKNGGIILITQYTVSPANWRNPTITWSSVHHWLKNRLPANIKDAKNSTEIFNYWTKNLIEFLEEHEMTGTRIILSDIIALPAFQRLQNGLRGIAAIARKELISLTHDQAWRSFRVPRGGVSGDFNEPQFFGISMTSNGIRAHESSFVLWCGVLASSAYQLSPHIEGIPELSVGFGAWTGLPLSDEGCVSLKATLKKELDALTPNMKWTVDWRVTDEHNSDGILFVYTQLSLIELHQQAGDDFWDDQARSFFRTSSIALLSLPSHIWEAVEKLVHEDDIEPIETNDNIQENAIQTLKDEVLYL